MAKLLLILLLLLLLTATVISGRQNNEDFGRTINRKQLGLNKKEKLTHLRFYWQIVLSGQNPSSIVIIQPALNYSSTIFGSITMCDNALTSHLSINSTMIGKSQGLYAGAAQKEFGLLMVMNFAFMTGKYNGSSITILGRNPVMLPVREMPVVGGSGMFRFARGYVEARTKLFDFKTGDATVEFNCYVFHY